MHLVSALRFRLALVLMVLGIVVGCQKEPPPPSPIELEQGVKELNDQRQYERTNQPRVAD
jgi:hypothetical protein